MKRKLFMAAGLVIALLAAVWIYTGIVTPADAPGDKLCTLTIRCDTIWDNIGQLNADKLELIPEDGVLLAEMSVTFTEGESVFDLLKRVTREQGILLEFVNTPFFASAYVEGIGNLYEMDCGPLSGWMFRVNGEFASQGCSLYPLTAGDVVEWLYTCDLGRDIGGEGAPLGGAGQ